MLRRWGLPPLLLSNKGGSPQRLNSLIQEKRLRVEAFVEFVVDRQGFAALPSATLFGSAPDGAPPGSAHRALPPLRVRAPGTGYAHEKRLLVEAFVEFVVDRQGFEPWTLGLRVPCSTS